MSAVTRELILEELGLMPQWTRRSLLTERAESTAEPVEAAQAGPLIEAEQMRAPTPKPLPFAKQQTAAQPALELNRDERSRAIAQMDWQTLQNAVAECTACELCKSRSKTVFGVGDANADWLVVGEAPGAEEDRQGEPFVGQAGKLLDNMLASVDRSRQENVYILNTLKCRPPQNRNPDPTELAMCAPFLHRQIEIIRPRVIMATGRFAVQVLLDREVTISSLRGKVHQYRNIPVIVTYHPAYLLRNMPDKIKAWHDLLLARKTLLASEVAQHAQQ